jgi:PAS domain-containing protein
VASRSEAVAEDVSALVQETLLGTAIFNSCHAVFVSEEGGRVIAVNDAACVLLGRTRTELHADLLVNLTSTDAPVPFSPGESEGVVKCEVDWLRSDGATVQLRSWSSRTMINGIDYMLTLTEPISNGRQQ